MVRPTCSGLFGRLGGGKKLFQLVKETMKAVAIVVAAGRGSRAAHDQGPKQYADLGGQAVLARALRPFVYYDGVAHVQVVIHRDDHRLYQAAVKGLNDGGTKLLAPVEGGATRQQSVLAGLRAIAAGGDEGAWPDVVMIHDAARPFVVEDDIAAVLAAVDEHAGAILALPVVDTLKAAAAGSMEITGTVPRAGLWRAQTPQAFHFASILAAHEAAAKSGRDDFSDDASIAEAAGMSVILVPGAPRNFKITAAEDFKRAHREIDMTAEFRNGTGFDVHAFTAGDHVWLCGVKIPHDAALTGHSDADVAMHALCDAIYGAIAEGDIGAHFPPSDPQWKGARSEIFLAHARDQVAQRGGTLVNVDVTILCEAPKIGPHRDVMRTRLAEILEIDVGRIGVKATTTEQLGFTGRREGIAAMASATVRI